MPELPDVVPGEPVESDWGNDVRDRVTSRYADASARSASEPFPQAGQLSWLDDPGAVEMFDGSDWVALFTVAGGLVEGELLVGLGLFWPSSGLRWARDGGGGTTFLQGGDGIDALQLHSATDVRSVPIFTAEVSEAANVQVQANGHLRRSTLATAFMDPGDTGALDTRTGLISGTTGIDLVPLINHLLDRIEALENP